MGKPVAARSYCATNRGEGPAENPQPIAQIIQRDHMGQLCVEHGHDVAPAGEGARLLVHSGFIGDTTDQESWNQVANLTEGIKFVWALECVRSCSLWSSYEHIPTLFSFFCGTLLISNLKFQIARCSGFSRSAFPLQVIPHFEP